MTETEKMLAGKIYDASDSHLADRRIVAHLTTVFIPHSVHAAMPISTLLCWISARLRLETMSFLDPTAPWQPRYTHTYRKNATFEKKRTAHFTPWNMVHRFTSGMTAGLPQMSRSAVVLPSEQAASLVQAAW